MGKLNVLYYEVLDFHPAVLKMIDECFNIFTFPNPDQEDDEVYANIDILFAPLGFKFDKLKIDKFKNLKIIASSTLNVPHIDMDYCHLKNISVCHLGNEVDFLYTITPTAELTWGLVIAITRRIPWAHKDVCSGTWDGRSFGQYTPRMLSNMNLGIIGLGRLGSIVASYGKAFGMTVYYYSPNSTNSEYYRCNTLEELAGQSDIISVHAHLTESTKGMIDNKFFMSMKPGSYFINTARGQIVDENALLDFLQSGHLGGAALDVLADEYEPNFKNNILDQPLVKYAKSHDNLIITPHIAGATVDAWVATESKLIEVIKRTIK